MIVESRLRTFAKTVTWRIAGLLATVSVIWWLTGRPTVALALGGLEVLSKMVLYYLHERVWARVRFGWVAAPSTEDARRNALDALRTGSLPPPAQQPSSAPPASSAPGEKPAHIRAVEIHEVA